MPTNSPQLSILLLVDFFFFLTWLLLKSHSKHIYLIIVIKPDFLAGHEKEHVGFWVFSSFQESQAILSHCSSYISWIRNFKLANRYLSGSLPRPRWLQRQLSSSLVQGNRRSVCCEYFDALYSRDIPWWYARRNDNLQSILHIVKLVLPGVDDNWYSMVLQKPYLWRR